METPRAGRLLRGDLGPAGGQEVADLVSPGHDLNATSVGGSRLSADSAYLTAITLPMVLIGAGQGATLSPLTAAGLAGFGPEDPGAASGLW